LNLFPELLEVATKMTETNRLNEIETIFREILQELTGTNTNGVSAAQQRLQELNPTVQELLALANKPQKLSDSFDVSTVLELPKEEDEDWDDMQRLQRELDELCSFVEAKEQPNLCTTCGSECISYNQDGETHWLCEQCYYGNQAQEIGYCGFPCDGYCQSCGGGYDGTDEI
jgi:hypothetical protein